MQTLKGNWVTCARALAACAEQAAGASAMMPGMVDDAMWILEKADAQSVLLPSGTESLDVNVSYSCSCCLYETLLSYNLLLLKMTLSNLLVADRYLIGWIVQ